MCAEEVDPLSHAPGAPAPSGAVRRALEKAFLEARPRGIVAAYLFGSHAAGRAHRESDVDVGVLLDDRVFAAAAERFEARVRLSSWLVGVLACNEVDVVILNGAPPLLGRRIVTDGLPVYVADAERERVYSRDVQLRAADLAPFLAKHEITLLEALAR